MVEVNSTPTDGLTRDMYVRQIKRCCRDIRECKTMQRCSVDPWKRNELAFRNELVELRTRLLAIEVADRDALAAELQKRQSVLEENRATTHE